MYIGIIIIIAQQLDWLDKVSGSIIIISSIPKIFIGGKNEQCL